MKRVYGSMFTDSFSLFSRYMESAGLRNECSGSDSDEGHRV